MRTCRYMSDLIFCSVVESEKVLWQNRTHLFVKNETDICIKMYYDTMGTAAEKTWSHVLWFIPSSLDCIHYFISLEHEYFNYQPLLWEKGLTEDLKASVSKEKALYAPYMFCQILSQKSSLCQNCATNVGFCFFIIDLSVVQLHRKLISR